MPPPPPENIFTKIGRLNEALQAINPKYRPTGFSITSIESCSKSVLEDATLAAETAVSTLLSVIGRLNCVISVPAYNETVGYGDTERHLLTYSH